MKALRQQVQTHWLFILFLALYLIMNLYSLTSFPFVHSDEAWLSGLSRNIVEKGDFSVTETFFDLKERHPHAIKIIFHFIQILFLQILDYSIFSVRLISLCFGLFSLVITYRLALAMFNSKGLALTAATLLAVDVQFIYASHLARQEIILVFVLLLAMDYFRRNYHNQRYSTDLLLSSIIGLSIGIHPNSFIISLPLGLIYLYHLIFTKKLRPVNLLLYGTGVAIWASVFIFLSLSFDPHFPSNYALYGNEFEVFNPISSKLGEIFYFYQKIFHQVSGTYYMPDIRLQFFLFAGLLITALSLIISPPKKKGSLNSTSLPQKDDLVMLLLAITGVNLGIMLIGRFNQTSVILQFPFFYLLAAGLIAHLRKYKWGATLFLLFLALLINTSWNMAPLITHSYAKYLGEIARVVQPTDRVVANLNTDYHFANGALLDYRNLAYLQKNGLSLAEYLNERKVQYIIYPEEMEIIYRERPRWNGMYGPPEYYSELQEFLQHDCELVHEFSDSWYGMRISEYMGTRDWKVRIYKVLSSVR